MLYRVAQIQLSMLPPRSSPTGPFPTHPALHTDAGRRTAYAFVGPRKHTDVHTQTPTRTSTSSHPTNSAVLSVPAWAAFTFAVLASAMFVAARVTRPLVTPSAHPAVFTAAAARHTNAMATTVRCTNLCGRQGHRKRRKKSVGKDRQKGRKGGVEMEKEDKAVVGQGNKGEEKTNPGVIVKERRPRSTTLSDGS